MTEKSDLNSPITRRQALRDLGVAGLGLTALGTGIEDLLARAAAASPKTGSLKDIEHVVILIQENRSFDHYFGTLSGVRGFGDNERPARRSSSATRRRQEAASVPPAEAAACPT